ncbi:MAG TPA: response regulator transcription factor [Lacunisphaera sp.]|nr:response regulator transcription factor [Lacunisphaera sp.]
MISVSIIEDDANVRAILHDWLAGAEGFRLVGEYSNTESAVARLRDAPPDVALVDINLPGQSGIECVRRLKAVVPDTQFLMLTMFEDGDHIFDALSAGASGYLLKRTPRDELLAAIREVRDGGSPMTSYIARKVVRWFQARPLAQAAEGDVLTAREREILRQLARGYAYKEIAHNLGIGIGTINTHVRRIYHKLHVSSRGEAVALFSDFKDEPRAPGLRDT